MDSRGGRTARQDAVHALGVATMLFLSVPVALFVLFWLRAPWSWLSASVLAWSCRASLRAFREPAGERDSGTAMQPRLGWIAGAGLLLLVVAVAGPGGFGVQTWDWDKHNAVLADLVAQPWPLAYRLEPSGQELGLVYYMAYYLPAAAGGKAFGWPAANVFLFLWTAAGVVLSWLWIARLGRASAGTAFFVFVLFTGFDILGAILRTPDAPAALSGLLWTSFDLEWWHGQFVYPGTVTLIAYAPHQALGAWLAAALALDALQRGAHGFPLAAPLTICLLWSPFAAAGLAALLIAFVFAPVRRTQMFRPGTLARRQVSIVSAVILAGVAVPLLVYLAAHLSPHQLPADLEPPPEAREAAGAAFLPATLGPNRFASAWASFLAVELLPLVAALALVLWLVARRSRGSDWFSGRLLVAASLVLAAVPFVSYGFYNDWVMRASIPALFALQVIVARTLSQRAAPRWARLSLAGLVLLAGLYPLSQLRLQAAAILERGDWVFIVPSDSVADLFGLQRTSAGHFGFLEQYVADARAPFFRYLAAPLDARSIAGPDASHGESDDPDAGITRSN